MKKILVPTDFSTHAKYALKVAAQIAREHDYEILLLNLLDLPSHMSDAVNSGVNIPEVMLYLKKTEMNLEELCSEDFLDGIKISSEARIEKTSEGITHYSKEKQADMIVMGSHGASGYKEIMIGSNTEKVVRHSDIPVLVIKNDSKEFKTNTFIFASDFTEECKKPFKNLMDFRSLFKENHLHLVMINTPNSFKPTHLAEEIMGKFLKNFEIENYSTAIYNDTNVENGIINYANRVNADVIGISTHGRTGLAHFFNGSISEDLVNHITRPVVTFKI